MKKSIFITTIILLSTFVVFNSSKTLTSNKHIQLKDVEALANEQENNNAEEYYYKYLLGQPKECTIYKHKNANGEVKYTSESSDFGPGWVTETKTAIEQTCPLKGQGCQAASCKIIE